MPEIDAPRSHQEVLRRMMQALTGDADPTGVELRRAIRRLANQYDAAEDEALRGVGLSGPRWALLLRLMGEEVLHARADISPTYLSRCLNVSKNTVSALLGGLEDQGFVERSLDPQDRRVFHIRLTDAGRAVVRATAPGHMSFLNRLVAGLTADERAHLAVLLAKLNDSIVLSQAGEDSAQTAQVGETDPRPGIVTERRASSVSA